ncbi:hypothetical protein F511_04514 [Dorcoceras hygrometricum]|uniref:DNA-directed RNA polymerase V subunit 1 n=1 Tax=Dorcoceras hygrometricum TaxID=472368 RepID=A0A2Z7C8Q8_9LAMI|nr:hypothetical protein F511_04514 [Dorcoceras hygrometricum]
MDILRSLQLDMLSLKKIVEDGMARSPVTTIGMMAVFLEMVKETPSTESADGFGDMNGVVRGGSMAKGGMIGSESEATKSTPEAGSSGGGGPARGNNELGPDLTEFVASTLEQRMDSYSKLVGCKSVSPILTDNTISAGDMTDDRERSTTSVLGKCVCLVTLAMSLFDLQDVCIAIGSLATLDLPMVVDLIGIYGLKGPYSTLTTTDWFLQALSVIPRGSWGDVARRFTMIRWHTPPPSSLSRRRRRRLHAPPPSPPRCRRKLVSGQLFEENPIVLISSGLLVQYDEGVSNLVVDRIDVTTAINREAPGS